MSGNGKWILAVCAVAAIVGAMFLMSGKKLPVQVAKAEKGTVRIFVDEQAKTTLPRTFHLTMPLDGRIKAIALDAGAAVKMGQVVSEMDLADLESRVTQADARVKGVQARIVLNDFNALEELARRESLKWIRAMGELVTAAAQKVEASRESYQYAAAYRDAVIGSGAAISRVERLRAEMEASVSAVSWKNAGTILKSMEISQDITAMIPQYIDKWVTRKTLVGDTLKKELAEAEAALAMAQRDLARGVIKSPVDGVVLKRYVDNERYLSAGAPLLDIGELSTLEVTADVLSREIAGIRPGEPVDVYGDALLETRLQGKVASIKPEGFTKLSSLGVEQQRVPVVVAFAADALSEAARQGCPLGLGYRVRVRIYTGEAKDMVKVPVIALFRSGDGRALYVVESGKARLRKVTVGAENEREAAIASGLSVGETVILAPPSDLADGAAVNVETLGR